MSAPGSAGEPFDAPVPDRCFPSDPYPGRTPACSFVHLDATSHPLTPDPATRAGWRVGGTDLDRWLAGHGADPMSERVPVLAFGSNRCPQKLTWLRSELGLAGPVVVLRADVRGLAAVWCAGWRARDGARPATLTVDTTARESHAVWMATPDQVAVLDRCEGRGNRYDLVRVQTGEVRTEDDGLIDTPWTYWPVDHQRAPLLVDGAPVRCADVDQDAARQLDGVPAALDGDPVRAVVGTPDPTSWPDRVFVYGTLRPGRRAWRLLSPHTVGTPRAARVRGRSYDTGHGFPALRMAADIGLDRPAGEAPADAVTDGEIVTLRDPQAVMNALDAYEGADYRRVRVLAETGDGPPLPCWAWVWDQPVLGWPVIVGAWAT